jgi:hypothetical protein
LKGFESLKEQYGCSHHRLGLFSYEIRLHLVARYCFLFVAMILVDGF